MSKSPKTKPNVPGAAAKAPKNAGSKPGHNTENGKPSFQAKSDAEAQRLAIQHRDGFVKRLENKKKYDKEFLDYCKLVRSDMGPDGVNTVKAMVELGTPEGAAKVTARIAAQAAAAKYMALPVGAQIELLLAEPDRTPSVDQAYDNGKLASASNQPRNPPHDPSVQQYAAWLSGYDDNQRELAGGIRAPGAQAHDFTAHDTGSNVAAEQAAEATTDETQH